MARCVFSTFKGVDAFGQMMDDLKVNTRRVKPVEGAQATQGV